MQVGEPSVASVVHGLIEKGVERLIVLPMYPQYSATTTAGATDALFQALMREKRVPALRIVPPYYDHPAYLDALTTVIREELARLPWTPDHYLLSFHGIPIRYCKQGDPYALHVKRTTSLLVKRLGWPRGQWTQTFQSLFGREEWLKPYTEEKLKRLAKAGRAARVRGHAGLHGRLSGDDRRNRPRGGRDVPPRRRRGTAPLPLSQRPSGLDRGAADHRHGAVQGWM